jgi:hypothetical protein
MVQIMALSGDNSNDDVEVYGLQATRLPQYDPNTGEPLFNDWRQAYRINVFDPRVLDHVTVAGQDIPLVETSSVEYSTDPFVVIRTAEAQLLTDDEEVEFKSSGSDQDGNPLPDVVMYSQRPSDVIGNARVITMTDGMRPTIQYVWGDQPGTKMIFSALATGPNKLIATLVSAAEDELQAVGWTAPNPDYDGSWGTAVSDKVRARIAEFWSPWAPGGQSDRWKTGVLVDIQSKRILDFNVNHGTSTAVELDVVCFEKGYNPKVGDELNLSRVIVYEIKTSADGRIRSPQLAKLQQMSADGVVNVIWTKWKWDQASNSLKPNWRFLRKLDEALIGGLTKLGVVAATAGVVVAALYSDQPFDAFEEQLILLAQYKKDNRPDFDIWSQELLVKGEFKKLVDALSGGTSDDYTNVMLLDQIYRKVLPRVLTQPYWQPQQP